MNGIEREHREEDLAGRHVRWAHATGKGPHQLAEHVAGLEIGECARILAQSPIPFSSLAKRGALSRVEPEEGKSFEDVIRGWTLRVLSGLEGD